MSIEDIAEIDTLDPLEIDPLEIDPRPCEVCGLFIDQHRMVDDGEGPEHFCEEVSSYAADLVRGWELADPRDRWKWTGEARPGVASATPGEYSPPRAYRTPQSTIDAFWYVTRLGDADYLSRWLAQHPLDRATLYELWEGKHAGA